MAKQKLLTKEVAKAIPVLGSTEGEDNPSIVVKFFNPANQWTWYAIEGTAYLKDGREVAVAEVPNLDTLEGVDDIHFFGLVHGLEKELGYFSFRELKEYRGKWGLGIERDMYFGQHTLREVMKGGAR